MNKKSVIVEINPDIDLFIDHENRVGYARDDIGTYSVFWDPKVSDASQVDLSIIEPVKIRD